MINHNKTVQVNSILFTFHVSYTGKHTIDLETVQLTKHVVNTI